MSDHQYAPRKIGTTPVTPIGFGSMSMGWAVYGATETDEERFKVLDRLLETGCTNWDTARLYGDAEDVIGKWFVKTGNRDKIFLATKFGVSTEHSGVRGDPEYVKNTVEKSLRLLQTDRIDLLYQHRPDPKVPIEITVKAMKEFVDSGKVKYLVLSEATADTIRRAHKVHPISALQIEYSPWERNSELIDTARELGITIVAYSPTGRGLVTGRYRSVDDLPKDDFRASLPRYAAKNWPKINALVDEFQKIASKHHATPSQIAIAWLLEQGDDVIPIPGSKQIKYNDENWNTIKLKLPKEDLDKVNKLCADIQQQFAKDDRYMESSMKDVLADTPPLR